MKKSGEEWKEEVEKKFQQKKYSRLHAQAHAR